MYSSKPAENNFINKSSTVGSHFTITLTEVFHWFFLSCWANARVLLERWGTAHTSQFSQYTFTWLTHNHSGFDSQKAFQPKPRPSIGTAAFYTMDLSVCLPEYLTVRKPLALAIPRSSFRFLLLSQQCDQRRNGYKDQGRRLTLRASLRSRLYLWLVGWVSFYDGVPFSNIWL
jgi:hypothetical protein